MRIVHPLTVRGHRPQLHPSLPDLPVPKPRPDHEPKFDPEAVRPGAGIGDPAPAGRRGRGRACHFNPHDAPGAAGAVRVFRDKKEGPRVGTRGLA